MNKILESLDEAIFTPELKEMIQEMYEGSISSLKEEYEVKVIEAEAKALELETSLTAMTEKHLADLESKELELSEAAKEYAEYVKEEITAKADEYALSIKEEYKTKANAYGVHISEHFKGKIVETLDLFLNKAVEDYLEDNRLVAESAITEARLNALLGGFDSLLATGAVEISSINEATAEGEDKVSKEIDELKESVSKLIRENDSLKKENFKLIKEGIIKDVTEDMSLVEKDKFEKLAKVVTFNESDTEGYKNTLVSLKSNVVVSEEEQAPLTESVEKKPSWAKYV